MSWRPRVTVAAVITDHASRHLLVEEAPEGIPVFNQPAGHLEAGESLLQAVQREVREETCRDFTPESLVGVYQWVAPNGDTYLRFCFSGRVGEPLTGCRLDPDITAAHWLSVEQIEQPQFPSRSPMVLQCLRDHQAGAAYPLALLHQLAP